ncbi:MAG: inositol monophosphatase family protein [Candidatus Aenigmatarchaeota archaeon]
MNRGYWLKICEETGEKVQSEIKKLVKADVVKIVGKGIGGDKTLFIDDKIEKIVLENLKETKKDFIFISEELGREVFGKKPEVVVIIDPLDGSDNFVHDIPFYSFTMSVATSETFDSVEVAYVKNLFTGDVYTAVKGQGAFKNGKRINVLKKDSRVILTESTSPSASRLVRLNENFRTRKLGCISLTMCSVAEGSTNSCIMAGTTRTLDMSASYLIAKEAGAVIADGDGAEIGRIKIGFDIKLDLIASCDEEIQSKVLALFGGKSNGWAVWITGLPGSGKSAVSRHLIQLLEKNKIQAQYLQMDSIRKFLTPEQKYDESERDHAYRSLVLIAKFLTDRGTNVVIDATGHKKIWRHLATNEIENFFEIYLRCPLEVCMEREGRRKSDLVEREIYRKANERLGSGKKVEKLGQVIGIDVKYEESENPDLLIETDKTGAEESANKIFEKIKNA